MEPICCVIKYYFGLSRRIYLFAILKLNFFENDLVIVFALQILFFWEMLKLIQDRPI